MNKSIFIAFLLSITSSAYCQISFGVVEITSYGDSQSVYFVPDEQLMSEKCDLLAQPNFWKKVMKLSPDSCIINIAETREILQFNSFIDWQAQTEQEKDSVRMAIRMAHGLDSSERIFVTSGKNHFYQVEKVIPSLSKGIEIFEREGLNPWYAQSILLIESPGKIAYSNVGAFGPFQLMKSVARTYGLTVNKSVDERKDFEKSAVAASQLISKSCIPNAKFILDRNNIEYNENDLWFKLFVLHIYHAGAGNVGGLIDYLKPEFGGIELIKLMWQSEFGGFKNASQNYSQVALASNLILEELLYSRCSSIYVCPPYPEESNETISHVQD
ncbi:MAG: transglycosylase SLT domain-containing protein [Flavobacteriales bacterium]